MSDPIVSIVGRPNVGKSTLFNRLIGKRKAIVDNKPGVTRDRNYEVAEWCGNRFLLVDTGGYLPESKELIETAVKEQVEIAISESDVILFLVDAKTGITLTDEEVAKLLLGSSKEVLLVVNKIDDERDEPEIGQFYKLGFGEPIPVSAMIGRRTGDFLDILVEKFSAYTPAAEKTGAIKIAVIGKENVGKSSLVNTLIMQQRQIVTEIPGTTRDSIDSAFRYQNRDYIIIDTAGLKKKARIKENILFYSNLRTYKSIQRADVIIYMIDAGKGVSRQDVNILMQAAAERKGMVCVFNKWDLVKKDEKTMNTIKKEMTERLGDLRYIPMIFTSVTQKQRLFKMLDLVTEIYKERRKRIPTKKLNDFFLPLFKSVTPPATQGREIKINYVTQVRDNPPLFAFYSNFPGLIAEHYKRFIENRLRRNFGFSGVPLTLSFRKK